MEGPGQKNQVESTSLLSLRSPLSPSELFEAELLPLAGAFRSPEVLLRESVIILSAKTESSRTSESFKPLRSSSVSFRRGSKSGRPRLTRDSRMWVMFPNIPSKLASAARG